MNVLRGGSRSILKVWMSTTEYGENGMGGVKVRKPHAGLFLEYLFNEIYIDKRAPIRYPSPCIHHWIISDLK